MYPGESFSGSLSFKLYTIHHSHEKFPLEVTKMLIFFKIAPLITNIEKTDKNRQKHFYLQNVFTQVS